MTKVVINTNYGDIELHLADKDAPDTVANFIDYINSGFYKQTIFHRVIKDFMIQGGGFDESMNKKKTKKSIQNEANNGLKNDRGTIAMARTSDPHSATSQFFINLIDNDFLNFKNKTTNGWGYAVFGKVTNGMEVVDKIGATKTGHMSGMNDVPKEHIIISDIYII